MGKKQILVLGLKTFGMSVVKQLSKYNCDVLAIDKDMDRVEIASEYATHAIQLDIKDGDEIEELSKTNDIYLMINKFLHCDEIESIINKLKQKYASSVNAPISEVIEYGENAKIQLENLSSSEEKINLLKTKTAFLAECT